MITFLTGKLASKTSNSPYGNFFTVDVNGVGYSVMTTAKTVNNLAELNSEVKTFTTLVHKEDRMFLCGFLTHDEREIFNIVQSVSGVGVKTALQLLEDLSPEQIVSAVIKEDAKIIAQTKGIGPKASQRLVLELKDKMSKWSEYHEISADGTELTEGYVEARSVLLSLGYSLDEISSALDWASSKVINKDNSEELLQLSLRKLSLD